MSINRRSKYLVSVWHFGTYKNPELSAEPLKHRPVLAARCWLLAATKNHALKMAHQEYIPFRLAAGCETDAGTRRPHYPITHAVFEPVNTTGETQLDCQPFVILLSSASMEAYRYSVSRLQHRLFDSTWSRWSLLPRWRRCCVRPWPHKLKTPPF